MNNHFENILSNKVYIIPRLNKTRFRDRSGNCVWTEIRGMNLNNF